MFSSQEGSTDRVLRLCINPEEYKAIMDNAHVSTGGHHLSGLETARCVSSKGFWWPTLYSDAKEFVRHCGYCQNTTPIPYATLYQVSPIPHWSSYIVKYLKQGHTDPKLPSHRRKAIKVEAASYIFDWRTIVQTRQR